MTSTTQALDSRAASGQSTSSATTLETAGRYADMLSVLGAKAAALNTALAEAYVPDQAHGAADAHVRTQTLADLHRLLRAMAGLVNDALGGWPDPPPEPR